MKKEGEKVTWLTCYKYSMALFEERAGIDMILVGDSMGMCVYGYPAGTMPVTMDECIVHTDTARNAGMFYKEAGVDAIKMEGGRRVTKVIRAIGDAGMVVCGHISLTPQSTGQFSGYKAQGRTAEGAYELIKDARAVQEAGAQLLLLEAVTPEVGKFITEDLNIPVYSIGAGSYCDGQLVIVHDMLGIWQAFKPKFVKRYGESHAGLYKGS